MQREFLKELEQTGYVHSPLPLHYEKSLEAGLEKKAVLKEKSIWKNGTLEKITQLGSAAVTLEEGKGYEGGAAIAMRAPFRTDHFPEGTAPGAVYVNFSVAQFELDLEEENWEDYNRISCCIKPDFPDNDNVHCILAIRNDGKVKVPDHYGREGYSVINLKNHEWNHFIWEFQDMARDCITGLSFYCFMKGYNGASGKECLYYFDNISVQYVEQPDHAKGWRPDYDTIIYSTVGYDTEGKRTAFTTSDADTFSVMTADGREVLKKKVEKFSNDKGKFGIMDFTEVREEGNYYIEAGGRKTEVFPISKDVLEDAAWKTINFLFCQRCGYPVPGVHMSCHHDMYAEHDGLKLLYNGGWHDAGDLSQFGAQSAEITQSLFEAADSLEEGQLKNRLMEEGEWGLDFLLRTRFGDGYRATHVGAVRYSDGLIGNFDDVVGLCVNNHPIDNFIHAASLAYSGNVLRCRDKGRGDYAVSIAEEDYRFAMDEYEKHGCSYVAPTVRDEHTYPTGASLFYSMGSIAASRLYAATKKEEYAKDAEMFADRMLECQEADKSVCPITGFFYRDTAHKFPQHFNHQGRESNFMRTLILLCESQPENPKRTAWENAMRLYAQYLKDIVKYTAPYGLIPSGVYSIEETKDRDLFLHMNPGSEYDAEYENWVEQIKNGVKLNDTFYLRRYPVWFSFRGNAAVSLESGKAATLLGKYFDDEELMQIGREQFYWIFGKNPSVQSNMYGYGYRYPQQYAISSGELAGELPVGMESFENEDIPYWPQNNNCTYKEVWTSPSRSLLYVIADLL